MPSRRLQILYVTPEFIVGLCQNTRPTAFQVEANALPKDVAVVGGAWIPERHLFSLTLESQEFEEIAEGERIPECPNIRFNKMNVAVPLCRDMQAVKAEQN